MRPHKIATKAGKALLVTNHLADLAGSEIIIFEFADILLANGWEIDIVSPWVGEPMLSLLRSNGFEIELRLDNIFPLEYNFCYIQHGLLPLTNFEDRGLDREGIIVTGHLSPFNVLEQIGLSVEMDIVDEIWCNSEETLERMRYLGVPLNLLYDFSNAAPRYYTSIKRRGNEILFVSNHPPQEVREASDILEAEGFRVRRIGRRFNNVERVSPEIISRADRIVSIGKTVQYGILAKRPVFVYDHFGGPGYLSAKNFDLARKANFSGRSHPEKYDSSTLSVMIKNGFTTALEFARFSKIIDSRRFILDYQLKSLFERKPMSIVERRDRIKIFDKIIERSKIEREAILKFWILSKSK